MNALILDSGSYLPETILTSEELGNRLGGGEEWILRKTGIRERRVAAPGEATSDLASRAAERALAAAGLDATDADLIVLATSTPDHPIADNSAVMFVAFGGGMTWGGTLLRWSGVAPSDHGLPEAIATAPR